jgi:hypothetical protein
MIIDLDDPASLDPAIAGAKAAWLAFGRRAGLPVLPGVVIPAGAGRAAIALGAEILAGHGTGRARLAIADMAIDGALATAVRSAVAPLGPSLVVRSSSPLEGDGTWAGAFTSYLDVAVDDLPTAIRGCWASAFSNGTVARASATGIDPADLSLAVLIQPAIAPDVGGTARLVGDEIHVVAVRGSPAALLQGWEPGVLGRIRSDGTIDGRGLAELLGPPATAAMADVLRSAWAETGATTCEWAIVEGRPMLLQLGREATDEPHDVAATLPFSDPAQAARLERMARTIRHAPGPLGEALVLPWALGEAPRADDTADGPIDDAWRAHDVAAPDTMDPDAALAAAVGLARSLTFAAWNEPGRDVGEAPVRAAAALAALRGPDPDPAASSLAARPAADPVAVKRLHQLLGRVRSGLVAAGAASTEEDAWYLTVDQARAALADRPSTIRARRPRMDPWMPFQAAVILASGRRRSGVPSGPGLGVGRLAVVDDARRPDRVGPRDVVLAPRPLPHLAPLLWDAAAVVTAGGGPGAHLFESARALGLPAVSGLGVDDFLASLLAGGTETWAIAVDGTKGDVAITPW